MLSLALLIASPPQDHAHAFPGGDEPAELRRGCSRSNDEITICGDRDQSQFRARPLAPRYAEKPLRAGFDLPGGGTGSVEAVQRGVGGVSVPAAMVTLRIPLGKRPKEAEPASEDK